MAGFRKQLLVLALASAIAVQGSRAADAPDRRVETLKQLAAAFEKEDCPTVVRLGRPLLDGRRGTGLPGELEVMAYELVVTCEWRQDAKEAAYAHVLRGSALDTSSDFLWRLRLGLELDMKRHEAAVATVEALTGGRGAALNAMPISWMWGLSRELKDLGKSELRKRLMRTLAGDSYAPEEAFGSNEGFRYAYAELLAESGEAAAARPIIAGLKSTSNLMQASLDPRFRAFLPAELDLRKAAEAELERDRENMAIHPDRLYALVNVAEDLRRLGRPAEAVDLLQAAAPKLDEADSFTDKGDSLNWYWDALGRSLYMLGRYDAMVDAFRKGAAAVEGGSPNVSQVLNLAVAQDAFGRGEDALRTLAVFADGRKSSAYGEMVLRSARGCAQALAGKPERAAEDLAYAQAHYKDAPGSLADLLLCLGDVDRAAAVFVRQLDDPETRADALQKLSDYDEPPFAFPSHPVLSRLPAVKARPEVRAAIERAGGVRRFSVQRGDL